jgi:hypothetical protein
MFVQIYKTHPNHSILKINSDLFEINFHENDDVSLPFVYNTCTLHDSCFRFKFDFLI